jgi:hypothetical protein
MRQWLLWVNGDPAIWTELLYLMPLASLVSSKNLEEQLEQEPTIPFNHYSTYSITEAKLIPSVLLILCVSRFQFAMATNLTNEAVVGSNNMCSIEQETASALHRDGLRRSRLPAWRLNGEELEKLWTGLRRGGPHRALPLGAWTAPPWIASMHHDRVLIRS